MKRAEQDWDREQERHRYEFREASQKSRWWKLTDKEHPGLYSRKLTRH
jgi:hypothetical protein